MSDPLHDCPADKTLTGCVLCKYRGCLVIAKVTVRDDGRPGLCPECGSARFSQYQGWTECDCGFAYLTADLVKLHLTRLYEVITTHLGQTFANTGVSVVVLMPISGTSTLPKMDLISSEWAKMPVIEPAVLSDVPENPGKTGWYAYQTIGAALCHMSPMYHQEPVTSELDIGEVYRVVGVSGERREMTVTSLIDKNNAILEDADMIANASRENKFWYVASFVDKSGIQRANFE